MAAQNISYNSVNLQTSNIITAQIAHDDAPESISEVFKLYNSSKNVVPYPDQFTPKVITLSGQLIGSTIAAVDNLCDTFRALFTGSGKNLDLDYAGATRRYVIAKSNGCKIERPQGLLVAKFTVELITQSLGQNTAASTLLNATGRTGAYYSDTLTFPGNAPYQQPIITITYSAISATGLHTVNVGNDTNGQTITINRTWATGDVLVIDSSTQSVQVNTADVPFSGAFPEFAAGSGVVAYSDDFTTRTFTDLITVKPLWL